MKLIHCFDYADLAKRMMINASEGNLVYAVTFYEDAMALLKELMNIDEVEGESFDISPPDYNEYEDEYLVTLDMDYKLSIEMAKNNGSYIYFEADVLYVDNDCSSAIMKTAEYIKAGYEVQFDHKDDVYRFEEDTTCNECSGDCSDCPHYKEMDAAEVYALLNATLKVML